MKKSRRLITGFVLSNSMQKTIVVRITISKKHPKFQKYISCSKKIKVHDEHKKASIGDKVLCIECRPLSKDKSFRLLSVQCSSGL